MTLATPARAVEASQSTLKTYLRPIDREGLLAFAEKGRNNPASRGTNKVHTVVDGKFRTLSYVGDHAAVVVDEPPHLFGQDTAPAPGEIVLSGLGGCLCVGITAVAMHRNVKLSKLEIFLEGDIRQPRCLGSRRRTEAAFGNGTSADSREGAHRRRRTARGPG